MAEVGEVTVTAVTVAPIPLAKGNLASAVMAAVNLLPFCSRLTRSEVGVLELKNFSQFVVISAAAPAVLEDAGADEDAAGVEGDVLAVVVLVFELLQAATVAASASDWPRRGTIPRSPLWPPETASTGLATRQALPQPAELHAAGTVPPGTSLNRPHRLASPTFQVPSWYTALPVWPPSKVVLPETRA